MPDTTLLWWFLPLGYIFTIAIELPILCWGLADVYPLRKKLWAGLLLTACTYPVVVLILPFCVWIPLGRIAYLLVAEIFAVCAECLIFAAIFHRRKNLTTQQKLQNMTAIVAANLSSFFLGELIISTIVATLANS